MIKMTIQSMAFSLTTLMLMACGNIEEEKKLHSAKSTDSMNTGTPVLSLKEVKTLFEEMEQKESFQPLIDLCSDSVVFEATIRMGTPISGKFQGKKKVTEYFNKILPEVVSFKQLKPLEYLVGSNTVVILGDDEYTLSKNGVSHHSPYAMVLKFKDDLIEEILIIQDLSVIWEAYQ